MSPILITAALLGQMRLPKGLAARVGALFGLSAAETAMLNEPPSRGSIPALPPSGRRRARFQDHRPTPGFVTAPAARVGEFPLTLDLRRLLRPPFR